MSAEDTPNEHDILHQTLLVPSALPSIITMAEFAALFPAALRDHSQVAALYRALQYQRALDTDHVRENIELEVQRGQKQRRGLHKSMARGANAQELDIGDDDQGRFLSSAPDGLPDTVTSGGQPNAYHEHNLSTILPAMEIAVASLEAEVSDQMIEVEKAQASLETSIGDLSDLRYGRLNRSHLKKELQESLKVLAAKSENATREARIS